MKFDRKVLFLGVIPLLMGGTLLSYVHHSSMTMMKDSEEHDTMNHGNMNPCLMGNQNMDHDHMNHNMMDHDNMNPCLMDNQNIDHDHINHDHEMTNPADYPPLTQAVIRYSPTIKPQETNKYSITITDLEGKPISQFETFQEKLLHLIVVSDNLEVFQHLHPTYEGNGVFNFETSLPQMGKYTLFADYKPAGTREQISVLQTVVQEASETESQPNYTRERILGNTQVNISFPNSQLTVNKPVTINFQLTDVKTGNPINDLGDYLGEKGHLVIVKNDYNLTRNSYIHSHASRNINEGNVQFHTQFSKGGKYKIWGQFNRNGEIITADFWLNIHE